ncbi:HNH endonuclease [Lysinibacter cavernae]|uniref:5-methylcytosine-specific restriction endonuclease McrA n=1 Tax=Lysinibacter cavernae TaxID=1640652 RepID=A0A7X5QZ60_9MICO|nr:HNH endonuclease [Lysinibacter cavernae]NIH52535.1 5-methylcytosine-specific restriction endonuclease McrA [Lysinibacter cavernae]
MARTNGQLYKRLRREFKDEHQPLNTPCWICGQPTIEWDTHGQDNSFELDHYHSVSEHPELETDPSNFRVSHRTCNNQRSNKAPRLGLGTLSQTYYPQQPNT